ncbi:MAG: Ribulose-phosphate 3-epimerase [Opitutia bacterium UBA7350]|nr:MAG: Ribulose-phosphate 3-epimerase [Opitutae bacterium UBA7350]
MLRSPHSTVLSPSLLAGDHAALGKSLRVVEETGLSWIHLDIMDGHFVPNLTFGPQTIAALRPQSSLFFDVHLMLDNPHVHLEAFLQSGADQVTIHVEPDYPVAETLKRIKDAGKKCGLALNPDTPAEIAMPFISDCDIVVIMSVMPGFGGQSFREDILPKIELFSQWRKEKGHSYRIQIDGGITIKTAPGCLNRGADTLVAGTAFYRADNRNSFSKEIVAQ